MTFLRTPPKTPSRRKERERLEAMLKHSRKVMLRRKRKPKENTSNGLQNAGNQDIHDPDVETPGNSGLAPL